MYKNVPLTIDQIFELRAEVNKVLEANMETFASKASRLPQLHDRDFDGIALSIKHSTHLVRPSICMRKVRFRVLLSSHVSCPRCSHCPQQHRPDLVGSASPRRQDAGASGVTEHGDQRPGGGESTVVAS
jgi:hypothetical protein